MARSAGADPTVADLGLPSSEAMSDIVNLNKARKQAQRQQQAATAAEKRIVHGRSKAERAVADARAAKMSRELDQHRMRTINNDQSGEGR